MRGRRGAVGGEAPDELPVVAVEQVQLAFAVDDADTLDKLSTCASNPINAYNADNAEELEQAFESIGGAIVALRLSK